MLDYVKEEHKHKAVKNYPINTSGMDFYHLVSKASEDIFETLKESKIPEKQVLLFPGLQGTPYHVLIDKEGKIRFRGHFTNGKDYWNRMRRHYQFIDSIVNDFCEVPKIPD